MPTKALFTSIKNEGPFLLEWVAYHRMIGFERIIIYYNDCTDGSGELLAALEQHGLVEAFEQVVPDDLAPQHAAASDARKRGLLPDGDWVMWLDADEFLSINLGGKKLAALSRFMRGADAISFNWRVFGDSDQRGVSTRFVSADYTGATPRRGFINSTVKTLFKMSDKIARMHLHQPNWVPDRSSEITVLNGAGGVQPESFVQPVRRRSTPMGRIPVGRGSFRLGQVNHYMLRNRDLYALKKLRGRGAVSADVIEETGLRRHHDKHYSDHNNNTDRDRSILHHVPELDGAIDALLAYPDIATAHQNCVDRTQAELDKLKADGLL